MARAARAGAWLVALVAALVVGAGPAHAGKARIAILGIEVVGDIDPNQTELARRLTNELRNRARGGAANVALAANSERELVDEKLMNGCVSEAISCMVPIGTALSADYLMFGKLERAGRGKSFQISIKLIRVSTRAQWFWSNEVTSRELGANPGAVAKKVYASLIPQEEGTLVVTVPNVDRATIYVDNDPVGTLSSNVFTTPLRAGRYKLAIEPSDRGWRRHEETVTIHAGDTRSLTVELPRASEGASAPGLVRVDAVPRDVGEGGRSPRTALKVVAFGSLGVAAAAGGYWMYLSFAGGSPIKQLQASDAPLMLPDDQTWEGQVSSADCDTLQGKAARAIDATRNRLFDDACSANRMRWIAGGVGLGLGAIGIGALYLAYRDGGGERGPRGAAGRVRRPAIAVTPIAGPSGAGATVRIDW